MGADAGRRVVALTEPRAVTDGEVRRARLRSRASRRASDSWLGLHGAVAVEVAARGVVRGASAQVEATPFEAVAGTAALQVPSTRLSSRTTGVGLGVGVGVGLGLGSASGWCWAWAPRASVPVGGRRRGLRLRGPGRASWVRGLRAVFDGSWPPPSPAGGGARARRRRRSRSRPAKESTSCDVVVGVVVAEGRAGHARLVGQAAAGTAQVDGRAEGAVVDVVGVLRAVAVAVTGHRGPGLRQELHLAHGTVPDLVAVEHAVVAVARSPRTRPRRRAGDRGSRDGRRRRQPSWAPPNRPWLDSTRPMAASRVQEMSQPGVGRRPSPSPRGGRRRSAA